MSGAQSDKPASPLSVIEGTRSEDGSAPVGESWRPVDVACALDGLRTGTIERPTPTIGRLDGGGALLYAGRVNGLAGDSGAGKTWTALVIVAQELQAGRAVLYMDLEDDVVGIVERLIALGVRPDHVRRHLAYVTPSERFSVAARGALAGVMARQPSLAVIDSAGEALALDGANANDDADVAHWFRRMPTWIASESGAAVLVLDHVTKKADGGGLWPSGSHRKRAAIKGAQYMLRLVTPYSQSTPGSATLVCAKDRGGRYRQGQHVGDLRVTPDGKAVAATLVAAPAATAKPDSFRPTALMEKISRVLEGLEGEADALSARAIEGLVAGKREYRRQALALLVKDGHVETAAGPRGATLHRSVRPFREADASDPRRENSGDG